MEGQLSYTLFELEMSFLGRALGQFLNRWMTDKVANSSAMRQTAKVAVKGVRSIRDGAKNVRLMEERDW